MLPVLVEALRRFVAAACLFTGIWMAVRPGPTLVVARVVDFERELSEAPYPAARTGVLADFVRRRTSGRTHEAVDTASIAFARGVRDGRADAALQRLVDHRGSTALVFTRDSLPNTIAAGTAPVFYLHEPSDRFWVSLSLEPADAIEGLDRAIARPGRSTGLILVPLALVFYFGLPRRRMTPDRLVYSRIPAVVLPDLLGLLGGGFFFALPIMILAERAPGQAPWSAEGGWVALTGAMWLMAALFLMLNLVAFHYATLDLSITDDALVIRRALSTHAYPWTQIDLCLPYLSNRGALLGMALILFGRSPGMVGQGLLVGANREHGLEIRMRGKHRLRIMANAFPGYAQVVGALRRRGINGATLLDDGDELIPHP